MRSSDSPRLFDRAQAGDLFLRAFGVLFGIAFVSLYSQVTILYGSDGLMPAAELLAPGSPDWLAIPTVFWLNWSDATLSAVALAGAVLSLGLVFNVAPRYCLIACWALYLSFVSVGAPFLNFQWDNLLLETAFLSLFLTRGGLRPKRTVVPNPVAVLLLQWLLLRLHVESGVAKLVSGDPTWRDLTAVVSYYETAPIPTWLGWYAHQMPLWFQQLSAALILFVELIVPWFIWSPRPLRTVAFMIMLSLQTVVIATANYTFFNYLTMALCLFMLDDQQLAPVCRRLRLSKSVPSRRERGWGDFVVVPLALIVLALSFLPFLRFLRQLPEPLWPIQRVVDTYRIANAYHLFASMTLIRREAVIEGSDDGETWEEYEFRYKPGNLSRPPPFVAPHQPRVDFQLWFLLLGQRWGAPYFDRLLQLLLEKPEKVAPLFAKMPYRLSPPKYLRVGVYRYQFTDFETRRSTGAWWKRELIAYSQTQIRR